MDRFDIDDSEFDYAHEHPRRRRGWRIVRRTLAVLFAIAVVLGVIYRHEVVAQYRAVLLLTTTVDAPVAATAGRWVTREPFISDTELAGTPVTIARPAGNGPWPTMIFITGADPKGRHEPNVTRLAQGLARSGILAIVPDLPGLAEARVTPETLNAGAQLVEAAAGRDSTERGQVSIASVSTGASIALLIAQRPESASKIRSITAIAPFADIKNALLLMTTGQYRRADGTFTPYPTDSYLERAITESLEADLGELPQELQDLLDNEDPKQFDTLYDRLPGAVQGIIEALSPLANADRLEGVHVEIATSTRDKYFPADESRALADALPDATLTVTDALDHAIPTFSLDSIGELAQLNGFLVRAVRATTE